MKQPGGSAPYRPDIDGLRCIAILVVILFHIGLPSIGGGFVGVDVFFAISGYLIGSHVYRETRSGTFSLRRFYERRAKRILPAFFFVIFTLYVLGCLLLSSTELKRFAAQALAAIASCSNLYFWLREGYFAPKADTNLLLMTWSLGVEEQFYVFFPLLMMLLKRLSPRRLLACLGVLSFLSFLLSAVGVVHYPTATFYLLPTRAWEIGLGCILGIFEVEVPQSSLFRKQGYRTDLLAFGALVGLIGSCVLYSKATPFPGVAALLPVGAALALIRTRESRINSWILSAKPLVWIGLVSYSWYLWHWPLLSLARISTGGPLSIRTGCLLALGGLLLSVFSYFAIEKPFRRTKRTGPRFLAAYGFACLLFAVPATLLFASRGWPSRFPQVVSIEAAAAVGSLDPCLAGYGESHPITSPICMPPHMDKPVIALMGDSHASALAYELRSKSNASGWIFDDLTKSSCSQLGTVTRAMLSYPDHAGQCAAYNKAALDYVVNDSNIRTVILAGFWSAPFPLQKGYGYVHVGEATLANANQNWSNFESGLSGTVRRLRAHHKEVIIATDVPRFSVDPLIVTVGGAIPLRSHLQRILAVDAAQLGSESEQSAISPEDRHAIEIITKIAGSNGAHVLDLTHELCNGQSCRYTSNEASLYVDQQHLSSNGARMALQNAKLF
ncbi:MAG: acyltransferase 3 family protein [Acidobacteriaceae bacterium]|nr:acyltransferase 3 family protein [Acidobacteriaceae bacterium]